MPAILSLLLFSSLVSEQRHTRPHPHEARLESAVMMTFVLSLSVGIAIAVLLGWHVYLILTAQTTIEFYQNQTNRSRARQWGEVSSCRRLVCMLRLRHLSAFAAAMMGMLTYLQLRENGRYSVALVAGAASTTERELCDSVVNTSRWYVSQMKRIWCACGVLGWR